RALLVGLRALVLAALVLFLFRPVAVLPPSGSRDAIVPILVDVSRSMRVADADGQMRIARTASLLKTQLLPALAPHFAAEVCGGGCALPAGPPRRLARRGPPHRFVRRVGRVPRAVSRPAGRRNSPDLGRGGHRSGRGGVWRRTAGGRSGWLGKR